MPFEQVLHPPSEWASSPSSYMEEVSEFELRFEWLRPQVENTSEEAKLNLWTSFANDQTRHPDIVVNQNAN